MRPNRKIRVKGNSTLPKYTGETYNFFRFSGKNTILCILKGNFWKKYNFMLFERQNCIFSPKKKIKKIDVPTLPVCKSTNKKIWP